jgi:hypothetical protein
MAVKGIELVNANGAPRSEEIGGDHFRRVLGNTKDRIQGSSTTFIDGEHNIRSAETAKKTVGNDEVKTVNRNKVTQIGGNYNAVFMGGDPLTAKPTNKAVDIQVLNGSYHLELGNPTAGASPAAMAGYNVFVNNGAITFGENTSPLAVPPIMSHVNLNTSRPESIALGGTVSPGLNMALQHAMLFEPFTSMMSTMISLLDSHTHSTAWGPSSFALAPQPGGFAAALNPMLPNIMSIRVKIGG